MQLFRKLAAALVVPAIYFATPAVHAWQMKQAQLMTDWAQQVDTNSPLPEYPRPQMVRANWLNLNGIWQFQAGNTNDPVPTNQILASEILVPFPMESAISGVKQYYSRSWYRRSFIVPPTWSGQRIVLHLDAVDLRITPGVEAKALRLRVAVNSLAEDIFVEVIARAGDQEAGHAGGLANTELLLPIGNAKLWSPNAPFLYDLEVRLKQGDHELDRVSSYFAMRQVNLVQDKRGFTCIGLNGQPLFEIGTLDQGFWPDGIYTAPTDEALQSDIAFLKSAGFNLARKHVKIEPDRWYYWCDKLGLLVWQDMPSGNNATPAGQREFEAELLHMVKDLYNHPSVIVWVLFNEGWGQYDTQRLAQRLKALDQSRLVDSASGWTDMRAGDIVDVHNYPGPAAPQPEAHRAAVLGEFGGLGLIIEQHSWSPSRGWGYRREPDSKTLANSYSRLIKQISNLHENQGLSAAVLTQTTDVETECNGLLSYDRAIAKLETAELAHINSAIHHRALDHVILADAMLGAATWKYTFQSPTTNWFTPEFDASGWREGPAGFGTTETPGALVKTEWKTSDIWLRRQFELSKEDLHNVKLDVHHDEDAEIYLNGVLDAKLPGFTTYYEHFDLLPEATATLKTGVNTLAVHCHQTSGGQYIDVGLVAPTSL